MTSTVGVIMNPRAGKDIRRLVANAPAPSDTSRVADLRRMILGAIEGGAERALVALDAQGLAERAIAGLNADVELLDIGAEGTGDDTAKAAAAMRERSVGVVLVSGGDGTHRDVARGWRNAPIVAVSGGTNNAFPQMIESTIAGAAAGLVVGGGVPLDELVAYDTLMLDVDVSQGHAVADLALVDVAVLQSDVTGGPHVWGVDGVEQILASIAEPWSVGLSAIAGLVAPTSRTDDRGILVELDPDAPRRVRAPIAPGLFVDAGVRSVSVVDPGQPVPIRGPAQLALDGERGRFLAPGESASVTLHRSGPRVIDIRRTFSLAVRRGHFYSELAKGS